MGNENQQVEQKPDPRFHARIAIFNGLGHKTIMSNYSVNMSTGGVFIETANILPIDTQLLVKFKLPNNDSVITCKARVAWVNETGMLRKFSLPPGMGLQFLDLSLDNMHHIRDYLSRGDIKPTW